MKIDSMNSYKYLSEIYDKSMNLSGIDYNKWVEKIINLMRGKSKDIKNILELGCGTGNLTKKLLDKGYEVVGIDKSYEMLDIARQKTATFQDKIILLQQDVCDLDFNIYEIDMILSANDLINYIICEKELQSLFNFCYKHLKKEGLLVFDISTSYKIKNVLGNNIFFEEDNDYCMIWQNSYDKEDKIINMYIDIFKENKTGLYQRFQEEHTQRAYEEFQIDDLLQKAGFGDIRKEYFTNFENKEIYGQNCERIFYSVMKI